MQKTFITIGVAALSLFAMSASAQWGSTVYCTGESPVFNPAWDAAAPAYQMTDLGGGLYGFDLTPLGDGPGSLKRFQWKATNGTWGFAAPGGNALATATSGTLVQLRLDTVAKGDGFIPDVGVNSANGICYTIPSRFAGVTTVSLAGDFNSWNATDPTYVLKDDGVAPDATAADGFYTGQFSIAPGSYGYKVLGNSTWDIEMGINGIALGGNFSLTVVGTDPIKFTVDINKGRAKSESTAPPITYPAALSTAWSTIVGPATQLFDDATNGDVASGDGIYARLFTVAYPADASTDAMGKVQVYHNSNTYPNSGGYPFLTGTTGTQVLVSFNTNVIADGYQPATNIVWVNPNARVLPVTGTIVPLNSVNVTGDFGTLIGATNWNPSDPLLQLTDQGASIYALTIPGGGNPGIPANVWKATGGSLPNDWTYQYGSPNEGFTKNGNNANQPIVVAAGQAIVFKVDAVLGRAAYGANTLADPLRPGSSVFNAGPSAVSDWALY